MLALFEDGRCGAFPKKLKITVVNLKIQLDTIGIIIFAILAFSRTGDTKDRLCIGRYLILTQTNIKNCYTTSILLINGPIS
jgi:hypothetical protein